VGDTAGNFAAFKGGDSRLTELGLINEVHGLRGRILGGLAKFDNFVAASATAEEQSNDKAGQPALGKIFHGDILRTNSEPRVEQS
jgi:hypothetical protein